MAKIEERMTQLKSKYLYPKLTVKRKKVYGKRTHFVCWNCLKPNDIIIYGRKEGKKLPRGVKGEVIIYE